MGKESTKIKCKECGKEINKKAEICPECGCRVKSNLLKLIIVDVLVIVAIILGYFSFNTIKSSLRKINQDNIKNQYVGTWKLQEHKDIYPNEYDEVFLDDYLKFGEENIKRCLGCDNRRCDVDENQKLTKICDNTTPTVQLGEKKDEIAIDFIRADGYNSLLCFRLTDNSTLSQISCKGVAVDASNPDGFYLNGGIGEEFGIVYKKQ